MQDSKTVKDAIYGHPLFALLARVYEKCEIATCTPRDPGMAGGGSWSSESVAEDIAVFSVKIRAERRYYIADPEMDSLMVQAIQVLRLHLLELEKVHELCNNLCQRYISSLKGNHSGNRMMDLVLGERVHTATPGADPQHQAQSPPGHSLSLPPGRADLWEAGEASDASVSSGHTSAPLLSPQSGHFSTNPLSLPPGQHDPSEAGAACNAIVGSRDGSGLNDDRDPAGKRKKNKKNSLSKVASEILRVWLFQHLNHPYPEEVEKKQLAQDTGLSLLQVNNWFINARRRIVQPMIDQTNRAGPTLGYMNLVARGGPYNYPQQARENIL